MRVNIDDNYLFVKGQGRWVKGQGQFYNLMKNWFCLLLKYYLDVQFFAAPKSNWTHLYVYPRRYTGLFFCNRFLKTISEFEFRFFFKEI